MPSLPAIAGAAAPPASGDADVAARLDRLRGMLGITGARLTAIAADGARVVASTGPVAVDLPQLDARTAAAGRTWVLGDATTIGCADIRFYAGLWLPPDADRPPLLLSLFDTAPRTDAETARIMGIATEAVAAAIIERQRRLIAAQARTIGEHTANEELRRRLFDRASATARIGVWQCDLSDESLQWTDGVYDIFELPRGSPVTREQILPLYTEASRERLKLVRSRAIATCTDFMLDAEIITARGNRRWMRLTGTVESKDGVATRIFGMKQDITEEKLMADRTRYLAEFDLMTGLANRSQFQTRLAALDGAADYPPVGALLLVDLDGFKQINDTHGHALGDECLKEVAGRLRDCCADAALVARIGGDELAVLLGADNSPAQAEALAATIVATIRRPFTSGGQSLPLSVSVGVALRGGADTPDQLFRQADTALYAAKARGRDTSQVFGAEAERRSA